MILHEHLSWKSHIPYSSFLSFQVLAPYIEDILIRRATRILYTWQPRRNNLTFSEANFFGALKDACPSNSELCARRHVAVFVAHKAIWCVPPRPSSCQGCSPALDFHLVSFGVKRMSFSKRKIWETPFFQSTSETLEQLRSKREIKRHVNKWMNALSLKVSFLKGWFSFLMT